MATALPRALRRTMVIIVVAMVTMAVAKTVEAMAVGTINLLPSKATAGVMAVATVVDIIKALHRVIMDISKVLPLVVMGISRATRNSSLCMCSRLARPILAKRLRTVRVVPHYWLVSALVNYSK